MNYETQMRTFRNATRVPDEPEPSWFTDRDSDVPGEYALFVNHIHFLAAHRGELVVDEGGLWIRSAAPEYTSWTPLRAEAEVPLECVRVRLGPWHREQWEERLCSAGFRATETFQYMGYRGGPRQRLGLSNVETVGTRIGAAMFARVQAEGFELGNSEEDAWWRDEFERRAMANLASPNQRFYLGILDHYPAACLLTFEAAGWTGIYGVATRPAFRRRGLSSALLQFALDEAAGRNFEGIGLQAKKGGYAADFYFSRGFAPLCELSCWDRPGAPPLRLTSDRPRPRRGIGRDGARDGYSHSP